MSRTYRDSFTWQITHRDSSSFKLLYGYGKWYTSEEHINHFTSLPRHLVRKYLHYPWYGKCPKWWNKEYHIRPQRRAAKDYIRRFIFTNSKQNIDRYLPSKTYTKPTVYYY